MSFDEHCEHYDAQDLETRKLCIRVTEAILGLVDAGKVGHNGDRAHAKTVLAAALQSWLTPISIHGANVATLKRLLDQADEKANQAIGNAHAAVSLAHMAGAVPQRCLLGRWKWLLTGK